MSVIPQKFKGIVGERILSSYDFIDLASGQAMQKFYGGNAGTDFLLSDSKYYSEVITHFTSIGGVQTGVYDHDYDITFALPRIIDGRSIANIALGTHTLADGSARQRVIMVTFKIRKWDGVTETDLATGTTGGLSSSTAINTRISKIVTSEINIPRTRFKAGDVLRVSVSLDITISTGDGTVRIGYAHDPMNRDDTQPGTYQIIDNTVDTNFEIQIPFKIDI